MNYLRRKHLSQCTFIKLAHTTVSNSGCNKREVGSIAVRIARCAAFAPKAHAYTIFTKAGLLNINGDAVAQFQHLCTV